MVHGGQLVSSRVQETDMGSRGVAMVESNGAQGFFMGQAGMDFKSLDDLAVVARSPMRRPVRKGMHKRTVSVPTPTRLPAKVFSPEIV